MDFISEVKILPLKRFQFLQFLNLVTVVVEGYDSYVKLDQPETWKDSYYWEREWSQLEYPDCWPIEKGQYAEKYMKYFFWGGNYIDILLERKLYDSSEGKVMIVVEKNAEITPLFKKFLDKNEFDLDLFEVSNSEIKLKA
jgi:hypothetical protein